MERLTVVSADGHMGAPPEVYRPYMEAAYRDKIDDLAEEERVTNASMTGYRASLSIPGVYDVCAEVPDVFEDVAGRLAAQDAEGIAAEILLTAGDHAVPFFHALNRAYPADVRAAGIRGYHRWVADVISESNGRLLPASYAGEIMDPEAMMAELRWSAEHGFVSAFVPGYAADPDRPPLFDAFFEPFWAACADLGLVLSLHGGWGMPQGMAFEVSRRWVDGATMTTGDFDLKTMDETMKTANVMDANTKGSPFALDMGPRQVLWQLMLAGVFDRHPSLRFVMTEVRADWLPETLAYLDERFAKEAPHLERSASEYFVRNCAVTPSTPHRTEVQMRREIGIDQFLFGADIPHIEGTWPHTREYLRDAFAGVPEDEARKILGQNAIRFYNLDGAHLDDIASRIGPTADEVIGGGEVDGRVVESLNARAGYLKPVEQIDIASIDERLEPDFASAAAAAS